MKSKKSSGLIYDRDGYKIWNPVRAIYTVSVQGAGVLSVLVSEHTQSVICTILPSKGERSSFKAGGVRSGIRHGIQKLHDKAKKFYDINKIEALLDQIGVDDDQTGYMSTKTHARLMGIISELTKSAKSGGIKSLESKLVDLASKVNRQSTKAG